MTSTSASAGTVGFTLQLGAAWFDIPLGAHDVTRLKAQVDARIEKEPRLADRRQELIDMLTQVTRRANRPDQRQVASVALRWDLDELDGVSVATLQASLHRTEGAPGEEQIEGLHRRLTGRQGTQIIEPAVEERELDAGRALRVQAMAESALPGGQQGTEAPLQISETVHYWVPVPGQPALLLVVFSTPNLAGAEALVAELDQMMEKNLRLVT